MGFGALSRRDEIEWRSNETRRAVPRKFDSLQVSPAIARQRLDCVRFIAAFSPPTETQPSM